MTKTCCCKACKACEIPKDCEVALKTKILELMPKKLKVYYENKAKKEVLIMSSEEKECTFTNCIGHKLDKKYGHCEMVPNSKCVYELKRVFNKQLLSSQQQVKTLKEGLEKLSKFGCGDCPNSVIDTETGEAEFCESCCQMTIIDIAKQTLKEVE